MRAVIVLCLALGLPVAFQTGWGVTSWWALALLAATVALGDVAVVGVQLGRWRWTLSVVEAGLTVALALGGGSWTVASVLGGLLVTRAVRGQPRLKAAFTTARVGVATALAAGVATAAGGGLAGAALGMGGYFLVGHTLTSLAVSTVSRRRLGSLWRSSAPAGALDAAGNTALGLLAAYLAVQAPVGLLALVVPLTVLWSSYDQQSWRTAEARLFAELARGHERAMGRSPDVSATVVLTSAARLLGGADVEMILVAADGLVRYAGDETGNPLRTRVDPEAFDAPWVVRALGARGVTTGTQGGRPYCSALLGSYDDPLAVLIARRPRGAASFGRRELRLVQALVVQAEIWLARGHGAGAGAGAVTPPTVLEGGGERAALRDSADRLARLAQGTGDIDDIIDELHQVERSVASLLGVLATSAGPQPAPSPLPVPGPRRPATDWTTTGVLA